MKLLVMSDVHLDWVTMGVSRFDELKKVITKDILTAAHVNKVDVFMFLGDLCNPDRGPVVFRCLEVAIYVAERLSSYGIKSVWLAGNHDVIEDGSGATTITPMGALMDENIHVSERPAKIVLSDTVSLITLPYAPTSRAYDPEAWVKGALKGKGRHIVAGHLSIPGVQPGEETTEMPRGREVIYPIEAARSADLQLNGHYHRRQTTESGIVIPGSLARLSFGEEAYEPGFLLIDF